MTLRTSAPWVDALVPQRADAALRFLRSGERNRSERRPQGLRSFFDRAFAPLVWALGSRRHPVASTRAFSRRVSDAASSDAAFSWLVRVGATSTLSADATHRARSEGVVWRLSSWPVSRPASTWRSGCSGSCTTSTTHVRHSETSSTTQPRRTSTKHRGLAAPPAKSTPVASAPAGACRKSIPLARGGR